MTVAVESFHRSPVELKVIDVAASPTHYWRKILLLRQSDRAVVQFGIVRLTLEYLPQDVREQIELRNVPLGRILISHDVLRRVELVSLWKVTPTTELSQLFQLDELRETFGRTARIYCHGDPAIELLEIVAPM
jgi:chorismate-pyruvate lyase